MIQDPQKPVPPTTQGPVGREPPGAISAAMQRMESMLPEQRDAMLQLQQSIQAEGYRESQKAQGLLEHITWQTSAAAKQLGDGTLNLTYGAWKGAAGLGAGVTAALSGDGFGKGWDYAVDGIREQLRQWYGTEDPGILDVMSTLWNGGEPVSADVYNDQLGTVEKMSVGEAGDRLIQSRLGNMAALGQTFGALAAFATGPGAAVGRTGASAARIATGRMESMLARHLAKKVGVLDEAAAGAAGDAARIFTGNFAQVTGKELSSATFREALKRGDGLQALGTLPEWAAAATRYQKLLRSGGRLMTDTIDITAANIAQSYLLEKDESRMHGAWAAAATSYIAAPLAMMGQWMGEKILTSGILRSETQMRGLTNIYTQMATGKLSVEAADQAIRAVAPQGGRIFLANALTSAAEASAFLMLPQPGREGQPGPWELWKQWQAGDDQAGVALTSMALGSWTGVVASKYAVPQHLSPMFKSLRPDLNTLKVHMEAEGFRRLTEAETKASVARDVEQEGSALNAEAQRFERDRANRDLEDRARFMAGEKPPADRGEREAFVTGTEPTAERLPGEVRLPDSLQVAMQATQQMYGWAEPFTPGMLRAGWEPEFVPGPGGAVRMVRDRDFHVTLEQVGDTGQPVAYLNEKTLNVLREFGREPAYSLEGHPDRARVDAAGTEKVLDDLSMVAWSRQMQGSLLFERLGMREISPGVWHNEETGRWYRIRLDGKTESRLPQDKGWSVATELLAAGGYDAPNYGGDGLFALKKAMAAKMTLAPDPLVDGIVMQAITMAEHSDAKGARELRQFFEIMDPVELRAMVEQGSDEWLSYVMGSLATGHNNAKNAAQEHLSDTEIANRQSAVRIRLLHAQKQERLAADQDARKQFFVQLDAAKDTVPDATVGKARIGSGIAETFRRLMPAVDEPVQARTGLAVLGRISRREGDAGLGVKGFTRVTAGELRSIAKVWSERMELHRQEPFEDTPEGRLLEQQISRVDDWLSETARDMGLQGVGETGRGVAMDLPPIPKVTPAFGAGGEPPPAGGQPPRGGPDGPAQPDIRPDPTGNPAGIPESPGQQPGSPVMGGDTGAGGESGERAPRAGGVQGSASAPPPAIPPSAPQGAQGAIPGAPATARPPVVSDEPIAPPATPQAIKAVNAQLRQEDLSVFVNEDGTYTVTGDTDGTKARNLEAAGARYDPESGRWKVDDFNSIKNLVKRAAEERAARDASLVELGVGTAGPGRDDGPRPVADPVVDPPNSRIVTARREFTPKPDVTVVPEPLRKHLREHQLVATAAAWKAMHEGDRGFLIASGTGAGKTRSILAVAKMHMDLEKRPVVVIAPNEVLGKPFANGDKVTGSYANDAKEMGIQFKLTKGGHELLPGKLYFTTYQNASNISMRDNPVLVFDEAHSLKNALATRSGRGLVGLDMIRQAHAVLFATATPADEPFHLPYLERIGLNEGKPSDIQAKDLGFYEAPRKDLRTKEIIGYVWRALPGKTEADTLASLDNLFGRLTAAGKIVKHEVSMKGLGVQIHDVDLPAEALAALDKIKNALGGDQAGAAMLGHQLQSLRRQQEPYKVAETVNLTMDSLARGRKVVIFLQRVKTSEVRKAIKQHNPISGELETVGHEVIHASDGTVALVKQQLNKLGITRIAELHGESTETAGDAMSRFQSGDADVVLATIQSGGTGINLDDAIGNAPRTMIVVTPPFSSVENMQALGRIWRLSTKSIPEFHYLVSKHPIDAWNMGIISKKMKQLGAMVGGEARRMEAGNMPMEGETPILDAPRPTQAPRETPATPDAMATDTGPRPSMVRAEEPKRPPTNERQQREQELADARQNRDAFAKELQSAKDRHAEMKKLPEEQRASKAGSRAMTELASKIDRLQRKINGLDRKAELASKWLARTDEENAAIVAKMRDVRSRPENAHEFIARRGGIKVNIVNGRKVAPKGWPLDSSPEVLDTKVGGKPLFTGNGMPIESAMNSLIENGYYAGKSIFGGNDATDTYVELAQEWWDGGDAEYDVNDPRVMQMREREYAKSQKDAAKAERETKRDKSQRAKAIEEASAKRGITRRLRDVEKQQKAIESGKMRPPDEQLPDVTEDQVAFADDYLTGERQHLEEGGESRFTAADLAAVASKSSPKQRVALVNEMRLEQAAEMYREQHRLEDAERLENVLKTGTAEQIAAELKAVQDEGASFSGPGISPAIRKKVVQALGAAGRKAWDWLVTDRLETLKNVAAGKWTGQMEKARSKTKVNIGEAQTLFAKAERVLRKMKAKSMSVVDVAGTPMYRWQALAEGRIQPANPAEQVAAEAMRDTGLHLWNLARAAGVRRGEIDPVTKKWKFRRLDERDKFVMPRTQGEDWDAFMGTEANRMRLWDWLIKHNDLQVAETHPETGRVLMDHGKPVMRDMLPSDLEARWVDRPQRNIDSAEEQAAFEFVRRIKNFPAMFEGSRLLQANPFEAFRRLIHEQSGRAAAVETWGQDFSKEARFAIEQSEGITLPPGAEAELRKFQRELNNTGSVRDNKALQEVAEDLLVTLQGTNPKQMSAALRALMPLESFIRASMTVKSFIHDIPAPFIQGTAYAGARRMFKAMAMVASSPREMAIAAERVGVLFRNTGMRDPTEADLPSQKMADLLAVPGVWTERAKTVWFDAMAKVMMDDWAAGKSTGNDRDVLGEMLRFSSAEQDALLSGKADTELQTRFRQEFVKLTTGRRTKLDGSQFLASPNLQQVVRFGNWISGRMVEMQRLARGMGPDRTWQQRARAMRRMTIMAGGYAALGTLMTTPLAYMIADAFKGENGAERWWNELSYAPASMVGKALFGQVAGGPTAQMIGALGSPKDAKLWANIVAPIGVAHAAATKIAEAWNQSSFTSPGDAAEALWNIGWSATGKAATEAGVIPNEIRNLVNLVQGWTVGQDGNQRSDAAFVRTWKRVEGIREPDFPRNKAPAFYDALAGIKRAIGRHPDDSTAALREAAEDIRKALELAPEESLAQSIRSFQHLDGIAPEERAKLMEFGADDERMTRIYAHDMAVREFASAVGRLYGEPLHPFEESLEAARAQARLGAADVWTKLVDQTTDDTVQSLEGGVGLPGEVRMLADAMASHPETLSWLSEKQRRSLSRPMDRAIRSRILQTIITRRARERFTQRRREQLRTP